MLTYINILNYSKINTEQVLILMNINGLNGGYIPSATLFNSSISSR